MFSGAIFREHSVVVNVSHTCWIRPLPFCDSRSCSAASVDASTPPT